jgi:hypothetical protein
MKIDCSPEQNKLWHASLFEPMLHYSKLGSRQLFKILGIGIIAITNRGGMLEEDISVKSVVICCHPIFLSVSSAAFGLAIGVGGIDCDLRGEKGVEIEGKREASQEIKYCFNKMKTRHS